MLSNTAAHEQSDRLQLRNFNVFPKHVGVWQGNGTILDANYQEIQRFTATTTMKIVENQWLQTNEQTYADGKTTRLSILGTAVGEGKLEFASQQEPFCYYRMLGEEHGDRLIIFQIWQKETGNILSVQTINLISDSQKVCTTQRFTLDGEVKDFLIILEQKL